MPERKTVIMVKWNFTHKWEVYSSITAFCSHHQQYTPERIWREWTNPVYINYHLELRRVPFKMNTHKIRRGGLKRAKPGPKGPRKKKT